jgi:methylmalonyl-CoA mutase cobalamin-binding subunit
MGVAKIFTPGAPTQQIVDWVNSEFGAAAAGAAEERGAPGNGAAGGHG